MDTVKKETLLFYTMAFVGGNFAFYSLLEHANVFGSAETSNMILLVENLLNWDLFHIIIRAGNLLFYALGIGLSAWLEKYHSNVQKKISIILDALAALILGFLPDDTNPIIALYPVAFAMSVQWCTFRGVRKNSGVTTFSTGNFRQLVIGIFNYITERKQEDLHCIKFYTFTLLSFHIGVAVIYIVWSYIPHQSIWFVFVPLAIALIQEAILTAPKSEQCEILSQNSGCEDV